MDGWFFNSWENVFQAALTALLGFLLLVAIGRIYGKRATSRMNNFDWMITVAIGAIFATTIIRKDVAFIEGLGAIAVLLTLQFAVTFSVSHWKWAEWLFLSKPRLLYHRDSFLENAMKRERIARQEVVSAAREQGLPSMKSAHAVVIESNSVLSVVPDSDQDEIDIIDDVTGSDHLDKSQNRETQRSADAVPSN
jgi:uncharacterized membrane protein YcaP (DUF421 family)